MKRLLFSQLCALVLLLLFQANDAMACSCATPLERTARERANKALNDSAAVFSGTVLSVSRMPFGINVSVKIRVEQFWKGSVREQITLLTGGRNGICGYQFKVGERYLVYAYGEEVENLSTNSCTRTRQLSRAVEDLQILGKGNPDLKPAIGAQVDRPYESPPWLKKASLDEYVMFDSFADLPKRERNERLRAFALAINRRQGYSGYVISYGSKNGSKGASMKTLRSIKTYLIKTKLVAPDRISFIDGGRGDFHAVTNFYLVPPGATAPRP